MSSRCTHCACVAGIVTIAWILAGARQNGVEKNPFLARPGDGGPANKATINGPESIAFDTRGNLYVYETNGDGSPAVIRKIDAATQVVTTLPVSGCDFAHQPNPKPVPTVCFGPITQMKSGHSDELFLLEHSWGRVLKLELGDARALYHWGKRGVAIEWRGRASDPGRPRRTELPCGGQVSQHLSLRRKGFPNWAN